MSLHLVIKRKADKTYTGLDYTFDGALPSGVKGKDKKARQRVLRRALKRETYLDLHDI